jgi:Cu/Ag efflux protein CusF
MGIAPRWRCASDADLEKSMMTISQRQWAVLSLIGLSACANPSSASTDAPIPPIGVDLGRSAPSGAPPATQVALVGEGHERSTENGGYQLAHEGHDDAHATGTVNTVDAAQHKLNISHNPIPDIGWPAMTMDFAVAPSVDLKSVKPGSRVNFTLAKGHDGMYEVQSVQPAGGAR